MFLPYTFLASLVFGGYITLLSLLCSPSNVHKRVVTITLNLRKKVGIVNPSKVNNIKTQRLYKSLFKNFVLLIKNVKKCNVYE